MEIVEIRDFDGPNMFMPQPAIKLEIRLAVGERLHDGQRTQAEAFCVSALSDNPAQALAMVIQSLHQRLDLTVPEIGQRALDTEGHHALFYPWEWRDTALGIAQSAVNLLTCERPDAPCSWLRATLKKDRAELDRPEWVRDSERRVPAVGITGTNGKTTTTRLISHIVRQNGQRAGWSSSSGVYIEGEKVLEGDYTGPSGAQRVLTNPDIDIAVLETARGGILLRGLGYESNDVGVFLNVSADHLGMHGVRRLETLAEVKSVVVQVTRPGGVVVLNADDPLVLACRGRVRAEVLLTSQSPHNPEIEAHIASGGRALVRDRDQIVLLYGSDRTEIVSLADVPMTYGGAARHMVENALVAAGAALGLGLRPEQVATGLRTFRSDVSLNTGRLNVFRLDGRAIVIDYAHNERGLEMLLDFTRGLIEPGGRLFAVVGTAGDRDDQTFQGLGRIAGHRADRIYVKENPRYFRGRKPGQTAALMRVGVAEADATSRLAGVSPGEHEAVIAALEESRPGDALAVMCLEEQITVFRELRDRGATEWE